MRLVHPLSARAKQAVIMRILSSTLARRAAYFSDGTTLSYCSWPPRWPRVVFALLKTRNWLTVKLAAHYCATSNNMNIPAGLADIEQVLREKKPFILRCMLDGIKKRQGRMVIWNRFTLSVSIT
jgi:hypothetical protein